MRTAWDFIAADNEAAADRVVGDVQRAGDNLDALPNLGRKGRIGGTRELMVSGTPYFLVYNIRRSGVEIARVVHGAQEWPPRRRPRRTDP